MSEDDEARRDGSDDADGRRDPADSDVAERRSPDDSIPGDGTRAPPGDEDPLGDLAERLDRRRERRGDRDDPVVEAFDEVAVDGVDADQLWTDIEADDITETVDAPRSESERDVTIVDKRQYCERCQYFSDPPEVRCTHAGTEIVEMEDTGHFRVADCPIVRGEENLDHRSS